MNDQQKPSGVQHFQAQAPVCPYCCDDHASTRDCNPKDLKKELLIRKFYQFKRTCRDEKQDARIEITIEEMIKWL